MLFRSPRIVRVTGTAIRDHLTGAADMSHELLSVVLRLYGQLDTIGANDGAPGLRFLHYMEPDFAVLHRPLFTTLATIFLMPTCTVLTTYIFYVIQTLVMADADYIHTLSIQKQIFGGHIPYDVTHCRMVSSLGCHCITGSLCCHCITALLALTHYQHDSR